MKMTLKEAQEMVQRGGYFMFMFSHTWEQNGDKLLSSMIEQYYRFAKKEIYGENWKVTLPQLGVEIENFEEKEVKGFFGKVSKVKTIVSVSHYLYFAQELTEEEKIFYRAFKFGWFSSNRFSSRFN